MIDTSQFRTKPFAHQIEGIEALVKNPSFALFDEMGAGKSAQVINAACILAEQGKIGTVVVVCPASVRGVWCDSENGEIRKHSWAHNYVIEFALGKIKDVWRDHDSHKHLMFCVTNYEILRSEKHLEFLIAQLQFCKTLLVLDESSYIKSRSAKQTKAVAKLREQCARCVILNGTPITGSPLDLWSQMQVLDHKILGRYYRDNFYAFRAKYAEMVPKRMGNKSFQVVAGYKNIPHLQKLIAPYVLRRLKKDCLDLPEKLYTVREVPLTTESWKRYQTLKKEAVIALGNDQLRLEPNAAVRIMRLAQLTSGILGGTAGESFPAEASGNPEALHISSPNVQDISSEKLNWVVEYLTQECTAQAVIVWCRWRRERERLVEQLKGKFLVFELFGGQSSKYKEQNIANFTRVLEAGESKRVLVAQQHAGGLGLNLIAATEAIYLSNDFSLTARLQSEDRCHRPGQKHNVLYTDVIATGPRGEKTIDWHILDALRKKIDLATLTCSFWRKALDQE